MTRSGRILIVEDEAKTRTMLASSLRDNGFEVEIASDGVQALDQYEAFVPHLVILGLQLKGMTGIELVQQLCAMAEPPAVIALTASIAPALEAMRAGAADYLRKPVILDELVLAIDKVLSCHALRTEVEQLHVRVRDRAAPKNMIGSSPPMQRVFEIIEQIAPTRASVLLTGERGTGKELVANAIHEHSPRAAHRFIKVHCAALAESLLDTELFGVESGSEPERRDGRFSAADGGTLFLDEVGEMTLPLQAKLLRVLQDHELERVGGTETIHVDVRVIAATNRDLAEDIADGRFREDLFYRLSTVNILIPPLRDRRSDIPALASFFLERYARENGKPIETISPPALELLASYGWPGNVRELENAIERAVVLADGPALEARHLPSAIRPATPVGVPPIPGSTIDELERYAILETMKATGGSTSRAAKMLGLSARTIQYRLHEYEPEVRVEVARAKPAPRAASGRGH